MDSPYASNLQDFVLLRSKDKGLENQERKSISLNKYISSTGICSRREADKIIAAGRVLLNGKIAKTGNRVNKGDLVLLDGKKLAPKPRPIYIALHKPVGIVSTTDPKEPDNIVDFVNHPQRLFHIGRLDKDSEGLIFLTNDGDIVNKILRADNHNEKEYIVTVDRPITPRFLKRMARGVPILGKITKRCQVRQMNTYQFRIILTEGMNRQIRRMCSYLGYEVTRLQRIRIMHITLQGLKSGEWREFTRAEIRKMNDLLNRNS